MDIISCCSGVPIVRPTVNFPPSYWGDHFISYSSPSPSTILENPNPRIEELKKEVKAMFKRSDELTEILRLIDDLQRLGVAYHFEEEIDESLRRIHEDEEESNELHIVALRFRLLRQKCYNVPSDVFEKFKDKEGKFKQELSRDTKGLLSLYEASWLGTQEEYILDEAMKFSKVHLQHFTEHTNEDNEDVLATQIKHALKTPLYRGMRRIEARHYIKIYQQEKSSSKILLEFAKLDFSYVQSLHQAEVKAISIWWQEWGLAEKLSFARDRAVEMYFWTLAVRFEPQHSTGRLLLTKLLATMPPMDDIFDAYGTLEELQVFNDMIQRWELRDTNNLPTYMRVFLKFFTSIVKEIENELLRQRKSENAHYLIETIKAWIMAYFEEARWANSGYIPTLEEYLGVSAMTSGHPMLICATPILMGEEIATDALEWIVQIPKIVRASSVITRIMDDLSTTEFEQQRMHVASSVQCYVNEHGVPEQEARAKLNQMVEALWKDMNNERLISSPSKDQFNMVTLDYTRIIELLYRDDTGLTDSFGNMKDHIASLLVHPLQD